MDWQKQFDGMSRSRKSHGAMVAARASSFAIASTGKPLSDDQFYELAVKEGMKISEEPDPRSE